MPTWAKDEVQEATSGTLPEGLATVRVTSMEEVESRNGKFGLKVESKVKNVMVAGKDAPQYKGMNFRFTFYIGTDDDPGASSKETWLKSYPAKRYKSFLKAASIPIVGNTEEECDAAVGAELMVQLKHRKYNDENGNERTTAEADAFFPIGDVSSEHTRANGLDKTVKQVARAAVAKKVAADAYVDDDE